MGNAPGEYQGIPNFPKIGEFPTKFWFPGNREQATKSNRPVMCLSLAFIGLLTLLLLLLLVVVLLLQCSEWCFFIGSLFLVSSYCFASVVVNLSSLFISWRSSYMGVKQWKNGDDLNPRFFNPKSKIFLPQIQDFAFTLNPRF